MKANISSWQCGRHRPPRSRSRRFRPPFTDKIDQRAPPASAAVSSQRLANVDYGAAPWRTDCRPGKAVLGLAEENDDQAVTLGVGKNKPA